VRLATNNATCVVTTSGRPCEIAVFKGVQKVSANSPLPGCAVTLDSIAAIIDRGTKCSCIFNRALTVSGCSKETESQQTM